METTRFCLDRGWRFTLGEQSVLPARINHETVYSFAKGDGAQGPAAANFRDDDWEAVDLPHDWQHLQPFDPSGVSSHGYQATGVGWYRRTFSLAPEDENGEVLLEFEGISGISDLYFNGAKLLHNESCYNGFTLSLTDLANFGAAPNTLCVRVDKTVWEGWWYEGCGVNRHVWLLKKPRLRIAPDGVWVRPERVNGQWRVRCEWTLENGADKAARGTVNGRVLAPDGREMQRLTVPVEVSAYDRATAYAEWTVESPVLWDVDSPLRYTLETSVVSEYGRDAERTRFGLRTLRVDADTGFWLNDRRVKLLGTCNHQDHAGIGAAIPADLWRWRVQQLKDMGSNAYRCSHNPPPKALLEACDELGMLVMDENRAYSTSPDALALLESMVRRDRNHPCVVMYSLFNEEPMQGSPKGQRLAKRQMAVLKRLDDTRPVLGAMNGGIFEEKGASPVLDVTGINYFIDSFDRFHALYPDRPFVSSETCSAFATRGCAETDERRQEFDGRDTACAAWGETVRQANNAVLARDYVMGLFVWTGFDYRGEPTPCEWPSVSSHFGILDMCGFPKDTYYLYQAYWRREPMVHVLPHWNHRVGECVRVMTYSNCDELELLLNGRSLGRRANVMSTQLEWAVEYEPGELRAVGYRGGEKAAEDAVRTAGAPARLVMQAPMGPVYRDTDSILLLNLSCVDERGTLCPLDTSLVTISVKGGRLAGVGNGDPNGRIRDDAGEVPLFYGRAQALAVAQSESVTVTACAPGLASATLTVAVRQRAFPADLPAARVREITGWRMSHEALTEKPDVSQALAVSDMNSMEPVRFTGGVQPALAGKDGLYALYRAVADVGAPERGRYLVLHRVQGTLEAYAGDRPLGRAERFVTGSVELELPEALFGEQVFNLVLQNVSPDHQAGVLDSVTLIHTNIQEDASR